MLLSKDTVPASFYVPSSYCNFAGWLQRFFPKSRLIAKQISRWQGSMVKRAVRNDFRLPFRVIVNLVALSTQHVLLGEAKFLRCTQLIANFHVFFVIARDNGLRQGYTSNEQSPYNYNDLVIVAIALILSILCYFPVQSIILCVTVSRYFHWIN